MTPGASSLEGAGLPSSRGRIIGAVLMAGSIGAAALSLSRWSADPQALALLVPDGVHLRGDHQHRRIGLADASAHHAHGLVGRDPTNPRRT